MIDISGLDKADVLLALWNASHEQGFSFLGNIGGDPLTREQAADAAAGYCDYVKGRVIKCDLREDEFDPRLFDRDNGPGAAAAAIRKLREQQQG